MPSLLDSTFVQMSMQNVRLKQENVDIRLHRIIYKVIEEIEAAMKGMLDPEYEEKVIGQAEVTRNI